MTAPRPTCAYSHRRSVLAWMAVIMLGTALVPAVGSPMTPARSAPTTNPCVAMICVPLTVHLWATRARGQATKSADQRRALAHARRQLAWANARFSALKVRFIPVSVAWLDGTGRTINGAGARDAVGRPRWRRGAVLWIGPRALIDLDGHTVRHGVHWRDRADRRGELTRRRWVIVARSRYIFVLAHELGHFLGLPHSSAPLSLMNKHSAPGRPGVAAWRFTARERRRMRSRLRALLKAGTLRRLSRPPRRQILMTP